MLTALLQNIEAGDAAEDAETRNERKYQQISDAGYIFQPIAFETQGSCGPSTQSFFKLLGKKLETATTEPRSLTFLRQRISVAIQIGNAASALGTIRNCDKLEEVYYI